MNANRRNYRCNQPLRHRLLSGVAALAILTICLFGMLSLAACNKGDETTVAHETVYDMTLSFDEAEGVVYLNETVSYFNGTGSDLNCLNFHLYPNAFAKDATCSPFNQKEIASAYKNGKYGSIEVLSAKIDRINCDFVICGADNTILSLPCSLPKGKDCSVTIESKITLPNCTARFGINNDTVNLTGFYPVLCRFENGAWREDGYTSLGDPFFSDASSFYVTATLPSDYVAASAGTVHTQVNGEMQTLEIACENVRDFALVLSKEFTLTSSLAALESHEVSVGYYSLYDKNPQQTADLAADALSVFSSAFGDYPYDSFTVVEAPINSGGMEYGGLVVIAPTTAAHGDTLIHETAHQWWYNVVGNDQINDAWLDEGLTEFCTFYYHSLKGDAKTFANGVATVDAAYSEWAALPAAISADGAMHRNLSSFLTDGEYSAVAYAKGALMFDTILELVGKDKFNASLKDYYSHNTFGVADKNDLIAAFEKNGCRIGGIIDSWVNGTAKIY